MKKNKKKSKKYLYTGVVIFILIFAYISSNNAKKQKVEKINQLFNKEITLDIQEFENQGVDHIRESKKFTYNSNPPTSGPHYAQAPAWGFYENKIDDESALHAVEHGGIWISYKTLNENELEQLREFYKKNSQSVIITKREGNNKKIAAVAWKKLIEQDTLDIDALQKFLLLNKNKTHEPLAK